MALSSAESMYSAQQKPYCGPVIVSTSAGFLLGDRPDHYTVPLFLSQVIITFVVCRLVHAVLRHLHLPSFISYMIAGVLLGRYVLGRIYVLEDHFLGDRTTQGSNMFAVISYMLFLFIIGVKMELSMVYKAGKKAVVIALCGSILPICAVQVIGHLMRNPYPADMGVQILVNVSDKWSVTSFANLALLLTELNLLNSKLGRLAMSASLIGGLFHTLLSTSISSFFLITMFHTPVMGAAIVAASLSFLLLLVYVIRPCVIWMMDKTPEGSLLDEARFLTVLLLALGCGLITELIGYHLTLGPLLLGLILPGGVPLGTTIAERLEQLVSGIFMPLFLVSGGLAMRFDKIAESVDDWGYFEVMLVTSLIFKFIGVVLPCLYCKMPLKDALTLGLIMNIKGIFELEVAWQWAEAKMVSEITYSVVVVNIIIIGGIISVLVKNLYRPEEQLVARKRRTIQHTQRDHELRILTCIHNQDSVGPIIGLLEASHPARENLLGVCVLHLVELVGRADAVLTAYTRQSKSSSESDRIANAFFHFAEQHGHENSISVQPYICISPYVSMHADICSLALEKKISLIVVPFHMNVTLDGTAGMPNTAVRAVNTNVLAYAPCSVGILIQRDLVSSAFSGPLHQHIVVHFLGGADDREGLAYAARMADQSSTRLTVVRFRLPEGMRDSDREEWLDDEIIGQFQHDMVDGERVMYREEVVTDGSGTVNVIKETSEYCSLLVVGRRMGMDSPLTDGMSMWSEYPELGVIGDLLASSDFHGQASVLVVQQQQRVMKSGKGRHDHSTKHGLKRMQKSVKYTDPSEGILARSSSVHPYKILD